MASTRTSVQKKDAKDALESVLEKIKTSFGKGTIMRMGENKAEEVEAISTGSLGLDMALGVGGFPKGRVVEIYGPESSGKTTLALHCIAESQKTGGTCAFIDAEHAIDPIYAKNLGVDTDNLLISQPDTGEQGLQITESLVQSGVVDVIVIDSVAALIPKAELTGEMGGSHPGLHARLMSQALRKLTGVIHKSKTLVIFLNQLRQKIGVYYGGNNEVTTGGNALKFYASVRVDIRRREPLKEGTKVVGNRTKVKLVKNKVAPPFKIVEFDIFYGKGIHKIRELLDIGLNIGVIKKSGAYLSYGDKTLGHGMTKATLFLENDPSLTEDLKKEIQEKITSEKL